jgi:hypothetical protein
LITIIRTELSLSFVYGHITQIPAAHTEIRLREQRKALLFCTLLSDSSNAYHVDRMYKEGSDRTLLEPIQATAVYSG